MRVRLVVLRSMGIGAELQELGQFVDDCERGGDAVDSVDLARVTDAGEGATTADLELRLSFDASDGNGLALRDPRVGPDGTLRFALASTAELIPTGGHNVAIEPSDATIESDDTVLVSLAATVSAPDHRSERRAGDSERTDATVDTAHGVRGDGVPDGSMEGAMDGRGDPTGEALRDDTSPSSRRRDDEVPPFRNPDLLAEVYESCGTFAEMAEQLDMDVTAETVRRYMIDYDIHEPDSYRTGDAAAATGDDGRPVVLSDGIGLPDDVTVDTLVETVRRSNTIYEVKQEIDVDRDDALEMLQELNLLDVVMGRLATEGEREITREDVIDRLREASAVQ